MKNFYIAGIIREDDGSGYSVYFPDVPNVTAGGSTVEEAIVMAEEGLQVALQNLAAQNAVVPVPSRLEDVKARVREEREVDGLPYPADAVFQYIAAPNLDNTPVRINISVPRGALEEIDEKAKAAGFTRSGFLTHAALEYPVHR